MKNKFVCLSLMMLLITACSDNNPQQSSESTDAGTQSCQPTQLDCNNECWNKYPVYCRTTWNKPGLQDCVNTCETYNVVGPFLEDCQYSLEMRDE